MSLMRPTGMRYQIQVNVTFNHKPSIRLFFICSKRLHQSSNGKVPVQAVYMRRVTRSSMVIPKNAFKKFFDARDKKESRKKNG